MVVGIALVVNMRNLGIENGAALVLTVVLVVHHQTVQVPHRPSGQEDK